MCRCKNFNRTKHEQPLIDRTCIFLFWRRTMFPLFVASFSCWLVGGLAFKKTSTNICQSGLQALYACFLVGSTLKFNGDAQIDIYVQWKKPFQKHHLGGGFKCFLNVHPYLGKISILTNIQMGWFNHQAVMFTGTFSTIKSIWLMHRPSLLMAFSQTDNFC